MSARRKADLGKVLGTRQASMLEYLWRHGPQSVSQIHQGIADVDGVAYTTIFTELSRMLKKGLVSKSTDGGSHLDTKYRAAVTRESVVSSVVSRTLGALIDAHGPAAVHGFMDAVADDPDALAELRRALDARTAKKR
jgi:predicted transcriptional regulator